MTDAKNKNVVKPYQAIDWQLMGEEFDQRRRATWPHNNDDGQLNKEGAMAKLASLFPSLSGRPGTEPWDAIAMLRYLCTGGGSHGEKLAARFLLGVWSPDENWVEVAKNNGISNAETVKRFDIFEAVGAWDDEHRLALHTWIETPFWP